MQAITNLLVNRRLVAAFILLVVAVTLALDLTGMVVPCPYCRTQRFALGVLSIILLLKGYNTLWPRYLAAVVGLYGLVVGLMQNFNHVKKINAGTFDWPALTIGHPLVLSSLAILALVWQLFLIFDLDKTSRHRL